MGKLMGSKVRSLLLCALGLVVVLLVPIEAFAFGEAIELRPPGGPLGKSATVVGTGWHEHGIRGLDVPIWIGTTEVGRGNPNANGDFSIDIMIPLNPPPSEIVNGKLRISAIIGNGGSADAFYIITAGGQPC